MGYKFVQNDPHEITWPEQVIQPWWEKQEFNIMQSGGLFEHIRLDRGGMLRRILMWPLPLLKRLGLYEHLRKTRLASMLKQRI